MPRPARLSLAISDPVPTRSSLRIARPARQSLLSGHLQLRPTGLGRAPTMSRGLDAAPRRVVTGFAAVGRSNGA
eukprot:6614597-Alexandrium_andersonii.AAC.1